MPRPNVAVLVIFKKSEFEFLTKPQPKGPVLRGFLQGCGSGSWKRSYFDGSGSAKNMPFPLPHHSKKHTVNNLLDIIFYSIY